MGRQAALPALMKAVRLGAVGRVAVDSVPVPAPGPSDVLLRVAAAGVCQTDVHIRRDAAQIIPAGTILGHEIAGTIVAVGASVSHRMPGANVVVHPCWACHTCPQCRSGRENSCARHGSRLIPPPTPGISAHGGMADYVVVPASAVIDIGAMDPAEAAVLADAGLAPYHSVRLVREKLVPGTTAVVLGIGGLGQYAVQILRLLTAARIVAVDISQAALRFAAAYADSTVMADVPDAAERILAQTGGSGAEVVIDLVGSTESLKLAAAVVAPYGAIQAIGLNAGVLPFEADIRSSVALPWGVTLMKPYSGSYRDLAEVIALARTGRLRSTILRFSLDDAEEVFDRLERGDITGRAVLIPNAAPRVPTAE